MTHLTHSRIWTRLNRAALYVAVLIALHPASLWACSACYGASDSPMAKGMNAGILSLLGVVVVVLGSIGGFFI